MYLRDFGEYNQSLFDDVLSEFHPLSSNDVLIVNWSAWYHRFQWNANQVMPSATLQLPCSISVGIHPSCTASLQLSCCFFPAPASMLNHCRAHQYFSKAAFPCHLACWAACRRLSVAAAL